MHENVAANVDVYWFVDNGRNHFIRELATVDNTRFPNKHRPFAGPDTTATNQKHTMKNQ